MQPAVQDFDFVVSGRDFRASRCRLTAIGGGVVRKTEEARSARYEVLDVAVGQHSGRHARNVSRGRILLVDDEICIWWHRTIGALAVAGYEVDTAEDGEAAWQALRNHDYDLLITDNKMPKLWGSELIERVRAHGMALPIILASTSLPLIRPGQEPHYHHVRLLEKPVSTSRLLDTMEQSRPRPSTIPGDEVDWLQVLS